MKTVSRDNFDWITQNTDQLANVPYSSGIQYQGKNYLPYHIKTDTNKKSWDVYENRIVIGFLHTALLNGKQILTEFESNILNEERIISRVHGSFPKEYSAPIITIKSLQVSFCRILLGKLKQSIDCLLRLLKLLADNGYQKADVKDPAFKYTYTSADEHYQNEKDVANTYLLSNNNVVVILYYQPVISAVQFENGLTLYRTTKPYNSKLDYYTPDFVLKFSSSEHDEEYVIFDAKFSSRTNIKKHSLPEVIRKYSCEMCVSADSCTPKMVWVLQGRVNSNENAIWRYHNSPLISRYRPITSFGIVSVNTTVDIQRQLWNEIRNNISLLQ